MAQYNLLLTPNQAFWVQPTANAEAVFPAQCNLLLMPNQAFPVQPTDNDGKIVKIFP